ncbi:MAG: hypothetical protein HC857_12945 [Synechococcales cyanobacterium RU_4_20]|nr:hypothetical protein [Synechococcales cyanobacterium RU_4_20]
MNFVHTLADRYQLNHVSHLAISAQSHGGDTLVVHCPDVAAANAFNLRMFCSMALRFALILLARDLNCPHIEVRVMSQVWLSYDLEDLAAMRQNFL